MSYSRWSNSSWYTFWYANGAKTKDDQVLAVWFAGTEECPVFRYDVLLKTRGDPELLAEVVRTIDPHTNNASDAHFRELSTYVDRWLSEVEEEYGPH